MLRHTLFATVALAAAALAAPAATAQQVDPDVRCMMVSNIFATKESDPKRREVAFASVAYYSGRISVRLSPEQVRTSIQRIAKEPVTKEVGQTMTACAREMQMKQVAIAQTLQQLARDQPKPKDAKP